MPDRPSFPVPDNLTPETYCLCIPIPNDPTWKAVISGLLFQPAEWFNWQRDEARSGKVLAQYWRNIYNNLDWTNMSCCCPEPLIQITVDGVILVSDDGGVTYHPATTEDPRNTAPQLPPLTGDPGDALRCEAANNVLGQFKTGIATFSGYFDTTSTVIEFVTACAGLIISFILLGPAAVPVIVGILLGLMSAIWNAGKTAYDAAFDDTVYGILLCLLYDNTPSDGIYTDANITAIRAGISTSFDIIARDAFTALLNGVSTPGMNTMARTPSGSDASCDECGATAEVWIRNAAGVNELLEPDESGLYTYASTWFASGKYYAEVSFTEDPTGCAIGNKINILSYDGDDDGYDLKLRQGDCTVDALANCYAIRQKRSSAPFTITFTLEYPDPCFA
jgi:hypothetical protein